MKGFADALPVVLRFEGGYANHPSDPGGATMKGVTQATYDAWRKGRNLPTRGVQYITNAEVSAVYAERYWVPARCDFLPWPLSLVHFDCAVNMGVVQAAKILQRAVWATPDGMIGPLTLAAVGKMDPVRAAENHLWERLKVYEAIAINKKSLRVFLLAWMSRTVALRALLT